MQAQHQQRRRTRVQEAAGQRQLGAARIADVERRFHSAVDGRVHARRWITACVRNARVHACARASAPRHVQWLGTTLLAALTLACACRVRDRTQTRACVVTGAPYKAWTSFVLAYSMVSRTTMPLTSGRPSAKPCGKVYVSVGFVMTSIGRASAHIVPWLKVRPEGRAATKDARVCTSARTGSFRRRVSEIAYIATPEFAAGQVFELTGLSAHHARTPAVRPCAFVRALSLSSNACAKVPNAMRWSCTAC